MHTRPTHAHTHPRWIPSLSSSSIPFLHPTPPPDFGDPRCSPPPSSPPRGHLSLLIISTDRFLSSPRRVPPPRRQGRRRPPPRVAPPPPRASRRRPRLPRPRRPRWHQRHPRAPPRRRPRHQLDQRRDRGRAAEGGGVGPLLRVQEEGDGGVPAVISTASIHPGRSHFSTPRAASWPSSSSPSSSQSLSTSASTWWSQRRRFPVASAAVELCEAATGGGDSVRVIETPQPNSSVKFSVEVPPLICRAAGCTRTTPGSGLRKPGRPTSWLRRPSWMRPWLQPASSEHCFGSSSRKPSRHRWSRRTSGSSKSA
ncbi:serine/arginine repetitive matrix protein 1 [Triticum aestivum]|uniref:serine/arginine repetitive matrix protein 1 n=1 Tax=Triticum aestivum TaxID=4565 RepID=UPI001D017155|nr:serine/arginine repetitive matrix protein 1-like [Triticum aestivum]